MKQLFIICSILLGLTAPAQALEYSSIPKGITLEGTARGIAYIQKIKYDKSRKSFIINDNLILPNPIKNKEFSYLIDVLQQDQKFGISVIGGKKAIYYGAWSNKGGGWSISQKLYAADEFFRGVVFGIPSLYNKYKLPHGYKPAKPSLREYYTAVWFNLRRFRFVLEGEKYKYKGCNIQVKLLPVKDNNEEKAADGGYEFDPEGTVHTEDKENVAHIKANAKQYLNIKLARPMIEYGKAAAIIRYFIDQRVDIDKLQEDLQ